MIVDLPGVQDSNAARAAVAQNYIKNCTGLWIVSPISRAVDDKAAKSLLGKSFKRQLKYDGTYSRVTFICSKTDDISITEATDGLGLQEEMSNHFEQSDEFDAKKKELGSKVKDLRESKAVYNELFEDADVKFDKWEALRTEFEKGETVYAPKEESDKKSKKRKRSDNPTKKSKKRNALDDSDDSDDNFESAASAQESEGEESESGDQAEEEREALTEEEIDKKIKEARADKKIARQERSAVEAQIKEINKELKELKSRSKDIEDKKNALCISGRNKYSK